MEYILRNRLVAAMFLAIISLIGGRLSADEPTYTKKTSLPALRITYKELQSMLDRSAKLLLAANASLHVEKFSERLQLKRGDAKIEITGHQLHSSEAKLPSLATEVLYTATIYPRSLAKVAAVSLLFNDSDRHLEVEGNSPEQVDAVFATLRSDFLSMSSPMGGSRFRFLSGFIVFMTYGLVATFAFLNWLEARDKRSILPFLFACLGIYLLVALPFGEIFAGFSVSEFDPSFASRYGPELTVAGIILTLVALPISYMIPKWFATRS